MIPDPPAANGLKLKPLPPVQLLPNPLAENPPITVVRRWFGSKASPPAAAVRTGPGGDSGQAIAVPLVIATLVTRSGTLPALARRK
jgi:hypothetical protein